MCSSDLEDKDDHFKEWEIKILATVASNYAGGREYMRWAGKHISEITPDTLQAEVSDEATRA